MDELLITYIYKRYLIFRLLFACGRFCFRPTFQTAHDPEAFHAASHQEGRGKRAVRQGKGGNCQTVRAQECSQFHLQHFVMNLTHTHTHALRLLGVCPLPHCHPKPCNRPVSDASVGRLS